MSSLTRGLITLVIGAVLLTVLQGLLGVEITGGPVKAGIFRIALIVYGGAIVTAMSCER